jgi:hypothetical protein
VLVTPAHEPPPASVTGGWADRVQFAALSTEHVPTPLVADATLTNYIVVMTKKSPTPVRFDAVVADRLAVFISINHGLSLSSAANMLVDEGLRMMEHPGVIFRSGPTGRRAGLALGPDVWEVVRAVKSARAAEPDLGEHELLAMVAENTGVPVRLIRVAVGYWAAYPDEVDAEITAADTAEENAEQAWRRERELLAG